MGGGQFVSLSYDNLIANPRLLEATFDVVVANFSLLDDRVGELLTSLTAVLGHHGAIIVQTLHPAFIAGDSYEDGWRTESFDGIAGDWREPMPWYFRTLGTWFKTFTSSGYVVMEVHEPRHADSPVPASVLFICRRAA